MPTPTGIEPALHEAGCFEHPGRPPPTSVFLRATSKNRTCITNLLNWCSNRWTIAADSDRNRTCVAQGGMHPTSWASIAHHRLRLQAFYMRATICNCPLRLRPQERIELSSHGSKPCILPLNYWGKYCSIAKWNWTNISWLWARHSNHWTMAIWQRLGLSLIATWRIKSRWKSNPHFLAQNQM